MEKINWNDAIDYATNAGEFIPSKEQAIELKLPKGIRTSTTFDKDYTKAWVHGKKKPVSKCNELRRVFLVGELITKQKISYGIGDV